MSRIIRELLEAIVLALLVFFVIQVSVRNFRVEGHSMEPTLNGGEYLIVNKVSYFRLDMQRLARLVPFWSVDEPEIRNLPFSHPPDRGDVIVFRAPNSPGKDFVKRVIGLPGEKVQIGSGEVLIDGIALDEPYLAELDTGGTMGCIPKLGGGKLDGCRLGANQYFVLGDNRDSSNDSRSWGPVHLEEIIGEVWFIYWPLSKLSFIKSF